MTEDEKFMIEALKEAQKALQEDEVPIGAVIVINNKIIARAHNQVETLQDATAHAEMIAITSAMNHLGSKYLENATIYITVEPCLMCLGAIAWARIKKIVFGAYEQKFGFLKFEKILNQQNLSLTNRKIEIIGGVLEEQAKYLMQQFFLKARNK